MNVRVLYFAVLRDIAGRNDEVLPIEPESRAGDVWEILRRRHPQLASYEHPPLIAVNESYATRDTLLREGDEVVFIPPVAGG